jgi:hypothetical protein
MDRPWEKSMHRSYNDYCPPADRGKPLSRRGRVAIGPIVIAALLSAAPASAETQVRGQSDNIYLQAENASIGEVLAALSAEFKLTYKLASSPGRTVTGVYSGPLQQVLVRVLDSHDYFIKNLDDSVDVVVLGASSMSAQPSPIAALAPSAAVNGGRPSVAPPTTSASVAPSSVGRPVAGAAIVANKNANAPPMVPLRPNVSR